MFNKIMAKIGGGATSKPLNTVTDAVNEIVARPIRRFPGGFEQMGAVVHPKDTRTTKELIATIEALAGDNPEIKVFVEELKTMKPEHLNLAADTLELSKKYEFLMTSIDMNEVIPKTGKSGLQKLLSDYPKASRENPHALELAQEVINNTDSITAKYFLMSIANSLQNNKFSEHLKAAKPMVKEIAEKTLNGGYLGTFERQENFMNFIRVLTNSNAKPEKVALLPKLSKAVDDIPQGDYEIVIDKFVNSDAPVMQVVRNINTLPEVTKMLGYKGDSIDVVDFVNKNVNLY